MGHLLLSVGRTDAAAKKLTVGMLQLAADMTHYLVPSKEPSAYLQAKVLRHTRAPAIVWALLGGRCLACITC